MLFPFTPSIPILSALCYFMVGLSQGPLWPAYWVIINNWFHKKEKSSLIAFISVGGNIGMPD
jgi:sugar phosphate permease